MKRFALGFLMTFVIASQAVADENSEIDIAPALGYSTYTGWLFGSDVTYAYQIFPQFQLSVGGFAFASGDMQRSGVHAGFDYNFSPDLKDSFFVGLEAGYTDSHSNSQSIFDSTDGHSNFKWGALHAGKRFLLSEKMGISYKPYMEISNAANNGTQFTIRPLNFSWIF